MDKNSIETTQFIVSDNMHETRLDVFVFQICDFLSSRSYTAKIIKNGAVRVNGIVRKASFCLKLGDVVELDLSNLRESQEPPKAQSMSLDIIYEDESIIVIHKPAGLVVHPGAGVPDGTLVNGIISHCGNIAPSLGNPARAGIVHRLDRDTSGVMVVAKTQHALTKLSQQFAEHTHERIYHAICYGDFKKKSDFIETGFGRDPHNRLKFKALPVGEGKRAAMHYKVLKQFCSGVLSLVECRLETGRTHQIRVQMAHLKHGIVGDVLYSHVPGQIQNNPKLYTIFKQYAQRQLLHALTLEITHPQTGERMKFSAPYAEDFANFLNKMSACV